MIRKTLALIGLAAGVFTACSPSPTDAESPSPADDNSPVYLSGRGIEITAAMWEAHLASMPRLEARRFPNEDYARDFVEDQLRQELVRHINEQDWVREGLDQDPVNQTALKIARATVIGNHLRNTVFAPAADLSDDNLWEMYAQREASFQTEDTLMLRHIFFDLSSVTGEAAQAKRDLANEVLAKAEASPESFNALRLEYSESTTPLEIIGPVSRTSLDASVAEVLWAAEEGGTVGPLENSAGIHLFQIFRRNHDEVNFEQKRRDLEMMVVQAHVQGEVRAMMASPDPALNIIIPRLPAEYDPEAPLIDGEEQWTIGEVAAVGDWGEDIPNNWKRQLNTVRENLLLARWGEEQGLVEGDVDLQNQLRSRRARVIDDVLWSKLRNPLETPTDEMIREHYENHLDRWFTPRRSQIRVLNNAPQQTTNQQIHLNQTRALRERLLAGEDIEALAVEIGADPSTTEPQWVYPHLFGSGWRTLTDLEVGDVCEPILRGQSYTIAQILSVEENVTIPFEDVAEMVSTQLRRETYTEREEGWWNALNADLTWSVPDEVIQHFVDENAPPPPPTI